MARDKGRPVRPPDTGGREQAGQTPIGKVRPRGIDRGQTPQPIVRPKKKSD